MPIAPQKRVRELVAVLSGKPEPADCFACFIGDVHFPSVLAEEAPIRHFQHLACREERLSVSRVTVCEIDTPGVGEVVAIMDVEKVSGHEPKLIAPPGPAITFRNVPAGRHLKAIATQAQSRPAAWLLSARYDTKVIRHALVAGRPDYSRPV